MKKIKDAATYNKEINSWLGRDAESAKWELEGIKFYKDSGAWQYERPDGLTNWEIDGQPFNTLKEAKKYALEGLKRRPLNK
jgi:hypothetical protein